MSSPSGFLSVLARKNDLNTFTIRGRRMFPQFHTHDLTRPVVRSSFAKKCKLKKTTCTSKTPRFRFRARDEYSYVMNVK